MLFKRKIFLLPLLVLLLISPLVTYKFLSARENKILSAKTAQQPSPSPTSPSPSPVPTPTLSPSPTQIPLKKSTYSVAIIGDSMVDTMGQNLDYLGQALKAKYPKTNFKLYNFGIGGQNVEQGLNRFDSAFSNQNRAYPALSALSPDVIIVASFAYNPFSPHDRNKHWLMLKQLAEKAKSTGAQVYILAEIAPLAQNFGVGLHGINWPPPLAAQQASHIVEQLENARDLARLLNVPLINAFEKSQVDGKFGSQYFVDGNDGIHPSVAGHQFMAQLIASTLNLH